MAKTQLQTIRDHLNKHGDITRLVAFGIYDVIDLRKIISDLRGKHGMPIETTKEYDDNGKLFTRYVLRGFNDAAKAA